MNDLISLTRGKLVRRLDAPKPNIQRVASKDPNPKNLARVLRRSQIRRSPQLSHPQGDHSRSWMAGARGMDRPEPSPEEIDGLRDEVRCLLHANNMWQSLHLPNADAISAHLLTLADQEVLALHEAIHRHLEAACDQGDDV